MKAEYILQQAIALDHLNASIFYSSCARLYGQCRAKRKMENLVRDLSIKTEQNTERSEQCAAS